jgi:hypothetical protein
MQGFGGLGDIQVVLGHCRDVPKLLNIHRNYALDASYLMVITIAQ